MAILATSRNANTMLVVITRTPFRIDTCPCRTTLCRASPFPSRFSVTVLSNFFYRFSSFFHLLFAIMRTVFLKKAVHFFRSMHKGQWVHAFIVLSALMDCPQKYQGSKCMCLFYQRRLNPGRQTLVGNTRGQYDQLMKKNLVSYG